MLNLFVLCYITNNWSKLLLRVWGLKWKLSEIMLHCMRQ